MPLVFSLTSGIHGLHWCAVFLYLRIRDVFNSFLLGKKYFLEIKKTKLIFMNWEYLHVLYLLIWESINAWNWRCVKYSWTEIQNLSVLIRSLFSGSFIFVFIGYWRKLLLTHFGNLKRFKADCRPKFGPNPKWHMFWVSAN